MATFYEPDPMGTPERPVWRVTLQNGQRLPMAVDEAQLQANGFRPAPTGPDPRLALGADMMGGTTPSLVETPDTRPQQPFVRADSPQFTGMLERNEAAANRAGVARPNVDTGPQSSGESANPAVSDVMTQPLQPYQSLQDRALARQRASARFNPGREAGFVPTSVTKVTENAPSAQNVEAINAATDKVIDANAAAAEQQASAARLQATEFDTREFEARQRLQYEQHRQAIVNERTAEQMGQVTQRLQELKNTPAPAATGLFATGGALGKLGGFLAVFMGGLGNRIAGGNGSQNLGVKGLEDAMNRDIEQQRALLAKRGDDLASAKGALADLTRLHGDPQMAAKELKVHQLEYALARGDAMAARSKSDEVMANWGVKRAELEAIKAREMGELDARTRGRIQEQFAYDPGQRAGYSMMPYAQAEAEVIAGEKRENEYRESQGLDPKLFIPEANAYAMRDDDRVAIVTGNEAANKVRTQLGRMRQIVTQEKQGLISGTEARQLFEQARSEAIGDTNKSKGFGAVDQGSMDNLLGKMIPDYSAFAANPDATYAQGQQNLTAAQREAYRQRGLRAGPAPSNMATPVGQPIGVEKRGAGERGQ